MTQFPEMDDPELQQLLDLEAAERGEAEFVHSNPAGADLDPALAELMMVEEIERTGQPYPPLAADRAQQPRGGRFGRRRQK